MKSSENKEGSAVPLHRNSSFGWELISNRQKKILHDFAWEIFFFNGLKGKYHQAL